jgi:hypothetical protein
MMKCSPSWATLSTYVNISFLQFVYICYPHLQFHPPFRCETLALNMGSENTSVTVSGEVCRINPNKNSCLIIVLQTVCDTPYLSLYIHALFHTPHHHIDTPVELPNMHSPISFSGSLLTFEDRELVVCIDDHSHFQKRQCYPFSG